MAVRDLVYVKDDSEFLHTTSESVDPEHISGDEIQSLIDDMFDTKKAANGVGISAVQVGVHKNIIVVELPEGSQAFINPEITNFSDDKVIVEEGCLSIPDVFGKVERSHSVVVKALTREGDELELKAHGMPAVIFQHEIDHTNGILFTDPERLMTYTSGQGK